MQSKMKTLFNELNTHVKEMNKNLDYENITNIKADL